MPTVVVLHGPAASGKMTIGTELAKLTDFKFFHNHLVIDALLALFPYGSPNFVKHRTAIWLETMHDAVAEGSSLIFTFMGERSKPLDFIQRLQEGVESAGGKVHFVRVACPEAAQEQRMDSASRKQHGKLSSFAFYKQLLEEGKLDYPEPPADQTVDSSSLSPAEAAQAIASRLTELGLLCR